jgi:hypothetical protein
MKNEPIQQVLAEMPPGFGLRQSSAALECGWPFESGRRLPQSKTASAFAIAF